MIGEPNFNQALTNDYKWDKRSRRIDGDIITYVDYLRAIRFSMEQAW